MQTTDQGGSILTTIRIDPLAMMVTLSVDPCRVMGADGRKNVPFSRICVLGQGILLV